MGSSSHTPETDRTLAARLTGIARHLLDGSEGPCPTAAAVADTEGRVFTAKTIISRSPGLSVCALRLALARAKAEAGTMARIVVGVHSRGARLPCGLCRQSLSELAGESAIFLAGQHDEPRQMDVAALLPEPFLDYRPDHEDTDE